MINLTNKIRKHAVKEIMHQMKITNDFSLIEELEKLDDGMVDQQNKGGDGNQHQHEMDDDD